jgi:hypothetical protein
VARLLDQIRRFERDRRFWREVDVGGREDCWPWHGGAMPRRGADVHAYELVRGPVPPGARLVHRCGDDRCVNPEHMDVVR